MSVDQVVSLARHLPPADKLRLIELIARELSEQQLGSPGGEMRPTVGLCADLGAAPSAEDIDEARQEMWSGFPRGDL
ncbi:MAG: hypothetical protein SCH98_17445 [Deferrisomatales bacterium]|nr:hypothetical protein [Deferrisomatales bacterium]